MKTKVKPNERELLMIKLINVMFQALKKNKVPLSENEISEIEVMYDKLIECYS